MKIFSRIIASVSLSLLTIGAMAQSEATHMPVYHAATQALKQGGQHQLHIPAPHGKITTNSVNMEMSYLVDDEQLSQPYSTDLGFFVDQINERFNLSDTGTSATKNYNLITNAIVAFDTLMDLNINVYSAAPGSVVVDTLWAECFYKNTSNKNDTLLFSIDAVDAAGYPTSTVYKTYTVILHKDVIFSYATPTGTVTDMVSGLSEDTGFVAVCVPDFTLLNNATKFAVNVTFLGSKADTLNIGYGFPYGYCYTGGYYYYANAFTSVGKTFTSPAPRTINVNSFNEGWQLIYGQNTMLPESNGTIFDNISNPYNYKYNTCGADTGFFYQQDYAIYSSVTFNNLIGSLTVQTSYTAVTCYGNNNGNANASASGGITPYTYSWSNGETDSTATGLGAETYTITVTDNVGATGSATVAVSQSDELVSGLTYTDVACRGGNTGAAMLSPSGGSSPYTYSWSANAGGQTTAAVSGLSAGTYTVTLSDNNGCDTVKRIIISQPAELRAHTPVSSGLCAGGGTASATEAPTGGTIPYTYLWTAALSQTTAIATGLSAGTYTVTVSDICGDPSSTASVVISQAAALTLTSRVLLNATECSSSGAVIVRPSGGVSPYTYSWNNGSTQSNEAATGLSAGNYTVTINDQCGSSATTSFSITAPAVLSVLRDSVADNGSNSGLAAVTVNGGTAPYAYSWETGGQTTDTIKGLSAGVYCCVIADANRCTDTTCITVKYATGIRKVSGESEELKVYPDPNSGQFTVSGLQQGMVLQMYDYTGKVIKSVPTTNESMELNINEADGIYLIRVTDKDGNLVGGETKVVKTE